MRIFLLLLALVAAPALADPVKLSRSGICHAPGTTYYAHTTHFTPYDTLEACLTVGRLPTGAPAPIFAQTAPPPAATLPAYHRDAFGHWEDADGDCQNTRAELLLSLSTAATAMQPSGCAVLRGRWYDPYTDTTFTTARDLDIDHVVPLSYAWAHGAHAWSAEQRHAFANDLRNLLPVAASANRAKGDAGPLEWLPPNRAFHCTYVLRFQRIVKLYGLDLPPSEAAGIEGLRGRVCR